MNDPMAAALLRPSIPRRILLQTPRVEKLVASISPSASEPEGMTPPQDLNLVPRRQPPPTPGFSPQVPEGLILPALEGAYLLWAPVLFDLLTLDSLEMTISHTPAVGKVHYHFRLGAWLGWSYQTPPHRDTWDPLQGTKKTEQISLPSVDSSRYLLSQWNELFIKWMLAYPTEWPINPFPCTGIYHTCSINTTRFKCIANALICDPLRLVM